MDCQVAGLFAAWRIGSHGWIGDRNHRVLKTRNKGDSSP